MEQANINVNVELNDEHVPTKILWSATDASHEEEEEAKAIMVSVWDGKKKESLGIDLWTEATLIGEMNAFFYQTLVRMSETYERATQDKQVSKMILDFSEKFADKVEEKAKEKS